MTLAVRARHAAMVARRADPHGFATRLADPAGWAARARLATSLAALLGLDPGEVSVRDDPIRRYTGRFPVPLLHTSDDRPDTAAPDDPAPAACEASDGSGGFWFVPETGNREVFLLLGPCPLCRARVPLARIAHLADLGDHLDHHDHHDHHGTDTTDAETTEAEGGDAGRLPVEFDTDPGHETSCPHHPRG